jgi:hypothetical protein
VDITTMSGHEGSQDDVRLAFESGEHGSTRRVGVSELEERIRHYNSDLRSDDPTFRAAVILLAGVEYGHNIDLLARRTGYDRALVARIARRLIDNGVWKGGVTVADWSSADEASGTFWNDVAVAEGKMCRRFTPDGRIEWAPAGFWNKNFGFIDPGADQRLATLYLDPSSPHATHPAGVDDDATGAESVAAETAAEVSADDAVPTAQAPAAEDHTSQPGGESATPEAGADDTSKPDSDEKRRNGDVPSLDDLFGDVVWIG